MRYPERVMCRASHLLALCALLASSACNRSQAQAPVAPSARPITITTARAEARPVQRTVETSGSLSAGDEVQAKSEQPGTISRIHADLGDRVAAGAVLADYNRREFELAVEQARASAAAATAQLRRMRDTLATLQAEVARAQSQADWARSEHERAQQLYARQLIAARDVDNARNGWNVAAAQLTAATLGVAQHPDQVRAAEAEVRQREAAVGIAEKRLLDTTVRAPIAGLVARRHVSAGEFVKENTPLFTLVVTHPLKYVGTVPERHTPELRDGQTVQLTVEAHGDRVFSGSVTRLAPAVDVATRTLALEARVPNADNALRPGFFAKGSILTRRDPTAVFVPGESVTSVAGVTKVFVVAHGKSEERVVKLASRQGTWIEIAGGVTAGEVVATSNLPSLFNGAPVELK